LGLTAAGAAAAWGEIDRFTGGDLKVWKYAQPVAAKACWSRALSADGGEVRDRSANQFTRGRFTARCRPARTRRRSNVPRGKISRHCRTTAAVLAGVGGS